MSSPLNPALYQALVARFGEVSITNQGQRRIVRPCPDPYHPGRYHTETRQRGEQYRINCPFCHDMRQRFYVSCEYGCYDFVLKRTNYSLFCCHNDHCERKPGNRDRLRTMIAAPAGHRLRSPFAIPPAPATPQASPIPEIPLPENNQSLTELGATHPASAYLRGRGFDPGELGRVWDLRYVSIWSPQASDRILIPIHHPRPSFAASTATNADDSIVVGWQARFIGDSDKHTPKYIFPPGLMKSSLLYGLPLAKQVLGPVFICEGPADVWRLGPGAVALFGKALSTEQTSLLVRHFAGRPLIVALDADAEHAALETLQRLRTSRACCDGDNRVLLLRLPLGCKDPAECGREELLSRTAHILEQSPPRC